MGLIKSWVGGFWSGVSVDTDKPAGQSLHTDGIFAAVALECYENPQQPIYAAILSAYRKLQHEGR